MLKRPRSRPLVVAGVSFEVAAAGEVEVDAGASYAGQRIRMPVRVVRGAKPGPRVAVLAGLRGDEVSAIQAAREILGRLNPEALSGDVLVVPVANVPGFLRGGGKPSERTRLQRSFPGDARGTAAERHAHALYHEVIRESDLVVLLGASPSHRAATSHVRVDLDVAASRKLALAFGTPLQVHDEGERGSLLHAATAAGAAAIQYDIGVVRQLDREATQRAVESLLDLLRAYEMLEGRRPRRARAVVVRSCEWARASAGGLVHLAVRPGEIAREGDPLAEIVSPLGDERHVELSPCSGLVIAVTSRAVAMPGTPLVFIGRGVQRAPAHLSPPLSPQALVGWSEWISLPDLGIRKLKAKIDTGARSSALHVASMRKVGKDSRGRVILELRVPLSRKMRAALTTSESPPPPYVTARATVLERVTVRDSGGHVERRPVIETTLELGGRRLRVRVTLTNRGDMLFPMLIGRTALGGEYLVDMGSRNLLRKR